LNLTGGESVLEISCGTGALTLPLADWGFGAADRIERITEPNRPQLMLVDITMLVMSGGRERTLAEFTALFAEAGFELEQTVVTRSPFAAPV
jgi:ubiquinone/menaquinone biosynthesis C-methylase UbiE